MLDYSALLRWKKLAPGYRPDNVSAALNDTFKYENPQPIPIVGEDGEPLDWIRNSKDRGRLESYLPDEYKKPCADTVKWFATRKSIDTSAYSTPYQEPRASNW
jgi:hypothetical protein